MEFEILGRPTRGRQANDPDGTRTLVFGSAGQAIVVSQEKVAFEPVSVPIFVLSLQVGLFSF
jgi:hypothetical protein